MSVEYTCANCGGVFVTNVSDKVAEAELKDKFGDIPKNECAVVCDDCYQRIMRWYERSRAASTN